MLGESCCLSEDIFITCTVCFVKTYFRYRCFQNGSETPRKESHGPELSVASETDNLIFEMAQWLKRQNGKQDTEKNNHNAKKAKRETAETDGTTVLRS